MHSEQTYTDPEPDDMLGAAIVAEVCLRIESAKLYGLIKGGPKINVDRCEEIIARARVGGYVWTDEQITAAIPSVLADLAGSSS